MDGRNNTPDLYGPMWLTITYMILLMICANLNDYFISANDQYIFNTDYCSEIIGIVFMYTIAEGLVYRAVVGCLKGNMKTSEVDFSHNLEYLSRGLCQCLVFYPHHFLYHSIPLCAYSRPHGRRPAQGYLFVPQLRQVYRVKTLNFTSTILLHLTSLFLYTHQKRILQLQKLLHCRWNFRCLWTSYASL